VARSSLNPSEEKDAPTPKWVYIGGILLILIAIGFAFMHLAGVVPSH